MNEERSPPPTLDASTLLAMHRTELSLESTRMGAERTQMSMLTTSLSLIGFGFTIYKFFQNMPKAVSPGPLGPPARNLGLFLVLLGLFLLIAGIIDRRRTGRALNDRKQALYDQGLLATPPGPRVSPNMVISVLLLVGGFLVLLGLVARTGPFG